MKPFRRTITQGLIVRGLMPSLKVELREGVLKFEIPSARALHDVYPLSSGGGEPETMRWIDSLDQNSVRWDVGAGVGAYALYASASRNLNVVAFEPAAASFAALNRNIEINGMSDRVVAYCVAFSKETKLDRLFLTAIGAGHLMHALGAPENIRGGFEPSFAQAAIAYSIDDICEQFDMTPPAYLKIDVDGHELKILEGAKSVLSDHVKSVIVEIDESLGVPAATEIAARLRNLGFHLKEEKEFVLRNNVFEKSE